MLIYPQKLKQSVKNLDMAPSTKQIISFSIFFFMLLAACKNKSMYKPAAAIFMLEEKQLPAYEKEIDHKGLLADVESRKEASFTKGKDIYNQTCITCHGTPSQEGSIPTAFKFWKDQFKVGNDPYTMYQTLTRGYGGMPAQTNLTPVEKYDVINYVREEFMLKQNKTAYFKVDSNYLSSIPAGNTKGPKPNQRKPWAEMDYGNYFINTYELVDSTADPRETSRGPAPLKDENYANANFAYKGIAVRLDEGSGGVAAGNAWMIFDHDLMRVAGGWTGKGFIDWDGILLNGKHNISPRTIGSLHFSNPVEPGWANPTDGSFADNRFMAIDKRRFGPLPRSWTQYKGLYHYKDKVIIAYTVGNAMVLEKLGLEGTADKPIFTRTLNIAPSATMLKMRIAKTNAHVAIAGKDVSLQKEKGFYVLNVPASKSIKVKILIANPGIPDFKLLSTSTKDPEDLLPYTRGGEAQYPQKLLAAISTGEQKGVFKVDRMELPYQSPWKNQMRLSGIDFLEDKNKAVICSTDGDIWLVEGVLKKSGNLIWKRIGAGLFQPLGIKVIDKNIFVTCRDQLVKLHDLNGDEEIDFYESFNSDHQVTNHFHEFAMGLQTDKEGNFYYAKSGRHARRALVPQHGTLIKVSKDGQSTNIIANGFRAANGVCINPDGSFLVTDQEGHWNPMNRINWVTANNKFYGNMFGYNPSKDSSDTGMEPPLVWVEKDVDRSPSELLWVDSKQWGPLNGSLLSFSYGYGKVFIVPHEKIGDKVQGGLFELPIPKFSTGVMRGRFNPSDGQLYACGLSAWGSSQPELGGFYRIRYMGEKSTIPIGLNVKKEGVRLTFSHALSIREVKNDTSFKIQTWDLNRSRKYGSDHYNTKSLPVTKVEMSADRKELMLTIPGIKPTWAMEINYQLTGKNGQPITGKIQNTIYQLGK
jgi:cytochrome c5